jgi:hypothetical protein
MPILHVTDHVGLVSLGQGALEILHIQRPGDL